MSSRHVARHLCPVGYHPLSEVRPGLYRCPEHGVEVEWIDRAEGRREIHWRSPEWPPAGLEKQVALIEAGRCVHGHLLVDLLDNWRQCPKCDMEWRLDPEQKELTSIGPLR